MTSSKRLMPIEKKNHQWQHSSSVVVVVKPAIGKTDGWMDGRTDRVISSSKTVAKIYSIIIL